MGAFGTVFHVPSECPSFLANPRAPGDRGLFEQRPHWSVFIYFFLGEKSKPRHRSIERHKLEETGFPGFKQTVLTHNLFPRSDLETAVLFLRVSLEG